MSEYRLKRRVQFHETDAAGIVHFSCFFRYMEEAEHALWREAGITIHEPGAEIGWPRVHASFDFQSALRFEQEFEVLIRIEALKQRSIRYRCVLTAGDTTIATGSLVIACVRRRPNEPMVAIDLPPEITERLGEAIAGEPFQRERNGVGDGAPRSGASRTGTEGPPREKNERNGVGDWAPRSGASGAGTEGPPRVK